MNKNFSSIITFPHTFLKINFIEVQLFYNESAIHTSSPFWTSQSAHHCALSRVPFVI